MDPSLALGAAGVFLSLADPIARVQAYLERVEETREVKERLRLILYPLSNYKDSVSASNESGNAFRAMVDSLSLPVKTPELVALIRGMIKFCDDYTRVLSATIGVAKQSNKLISDLDTFMQKVERTMPEVCETIKFFGKHYDPKTGSLDLANLPEFLTARGLRIDGKNKKKAEGLSKQVEEGGRSVDKAIRAAKSIGQQSLRIKDRRLMKEFPASYKGLFKEIGHLKATKETATELSSNAPPWLVELAKILERVQKTMPELSKPTYRYPRFPGSKSTSHRR